MRSLVISVCRSGGWLAAYWGRAQGTGVEAAVLSCCLVRHVRKSAWPKSERTFCWSFPRALRSVYGDEQFSGLPWSGYHHNTTIITFTWLSCAFPKQDKNPLCSTSLSDGKSAEKLRALPRWLALPRFAGNSQDNAVFPRLLRVIFLCLGYLKHIRLIRWCMLYSKEGQA